MFAIIMISGHQHRVEKDQVLLTDLTGTAAGKEFVCKDVMMVGEGTGVKVGKPYVSGATVKIKVLDDVRGTKIPGFYVPETERNAPRLGPPPVASKSAGGGDQGLIEVHLMHGPGDRMIGLTASGHAHWGPVGSDPLCAAVSVLVQNLDASLELILGIVVERDEKKGFHRILIPVESADAKSDLLFASAVLGLRTLAEQFPDRVRLA